jgi:hypothetical protein
MKDGALVALDTPDALMRDTCTTTLEAAFLNVINNVQPVQAAGAAVA